MSGGPLARCGVAGQNGQGWRAELEAVGRSIGVPASSFPGRPGKPDLPNGGVRFPLETVSRADQTEGMELDQDVCYRAVKGRDRRFDGVFYTAVRTTGIYCRPSCPAITPKQGNVTFYRTAAAAQAAGYRACRRCLPDATPGLPGVGRRGRRRVPCDAAGRRRRRGARGRRRARPGARLLHPPAQPRGHPAVRRGAARPRPVPTSPDRAGADRDHRPHLRRRGLRRRLPQRAPVQRHDPRGLRRQPDGPPQQGRQATPARHLGHHPHPDRRPRTVRGRRTAPLPRGARHRRRRGLRAWLVRARAAPAPRPGSGPRRAGGPAARLRRVPVHPGRRA